MKTLCFFAVLLLFGTIGFSCEENHGSDLSSAKGNNQIEPASSKDNHHASPPSANGANDDTPHWYASPEWWLVILGYPTLFVLVWQACATARSVKLQEATSRQYVDIKDDDWKIRSQIPPGGAVNSPSLSRS